jgi:hypothetical protein
MIRSFCTFACGRSPSPAAHSTIVPATGPVVVFARKGRQKLSAFGLFALNVGLNKSETWFQLMSVPANGFYADAQ